MDSQQRDFEVNDRVRIAQHAEMYSGDIEDGYGPGQVVTVKKVRLDEVLLVEAEDGHVMCFWPSEVELLVQERNTERECMKGVQRRRRYICSVCVRYTVLEYPALIMDTSALVCDECVHTRDHHHSVDLDCRYCRVRARGAR